MNRSLPNILTLARGLGALAIIALFLSGWDQRYPAVYIVFVLAALTDHLDGRLARRWNVVSDFGIVFDPLFDKILVLSLLILIYPLNIIHPAFIMVLFIRDLSTDVMKNFLLSKGIKTPAILTAKLKTATQMAMLHFVLLFLVFPKLLFLSRIAVGFSFFAVLFSLWSGFIYLKKLITFMKSAPIGNKM
jgi:CDP-diacylglycerol--glycerol-3-phosphate 3-phosphatidyltransferase